MNTSQPLAIVANMVIRAVNCVTLCEMIVVRCKRSYSIGAAAGLLLCSLTAPGFGAERPILHNANSRERRTVENILGEDIAFGLRGPMAPGLKIGSVDLDNDGDDDLIVMQSRECSNHACNYHFLIQDAPSFWSAVPYVESYAVPYVDDEGESEVGMRDVVIFDHVTDDCEACSKPMAVRLTWDGTKYETSGIVADQDSFPLGL
ncbi:hypothetical protein [Rhizobium ruizarguesonis]|uniref:hypothetical protein n=1 Tax=Rhizobium ruizarguesonis TaxID=2081791 RepID=UPI00103238BA|nr:hypothetical protein [Rhizobium ruizarguesonis]TAT70085.1 hypothetical protein ELI52_38335 [Rhizobium ruizarguesonis]